jgi:hypothetical protein
MASGAVAVSVWSGSSNDVWAGTNAGFIYHYNGTSWTGTDLTFGSRVAPDLTGVWASGPNDVFAVDSYMSGGYYHFNGTAWSHPDFAPLPSPLYVSAEAIAGSGPNDVWVTGDRTLHFDGTRWSDVGANGLTDVWVAGPGNVFLAGGALVHWNGAGWTVVGPSGRTIWSDGANMILGGVGARQYMP